MDDIINESIKNRKTLLPLSSGLDSRTLFSNMCKKENLILFSYEFKGGVNENKICNRLSDLFEIPSYLFEIEKSYIWNKIDQLYEGNKCFTDFTHPRQMGVIDGLENIGEVVLLGHWGDVLFDCHYKNNKISFDEQVNFLINKIVKPSGLELANDLWAHWGMQDSFEINFINRITNLYREIQIDNVSARIRAFKSLYWAPRWTSINLLFFDCLGEVVVPYYSNRMCEFMECSN